MSAPFQHATSACVLSEEGHDAHDLASCLLVLVPLLEAASLAPIIAVVPKDIVVPAPARAVVAEHGPRARRDAASPLRWALTQLLNVPVTGALVVPARATPTLPSLLAMLDTARRGRAMLVRGGEGDALLWAHRDVWRDLLTATGGIDEVALRYGVVHVPAVVLSSPRAAAGDSARGQSGGPA